MKHPIIQLVEYYDEYVEKMPSQIVETLEGNLALKSKPTLDGFMAFLKKKMEDV